MTIEVEREMDGIFYYVSVAVSLAGDDIDARVAEDVPELEISGYERSTGQATHAPTGALAFAQGDEIELDDKETTRAIKARAEGLGPWAEGARAEIDIAHFPPLHHLTEAGHSTGPQPALPLKT